MSKKKIGELIIEARKKKNVSQGDLAKSLNVSRQTISRWENNKALPDSKSLTKLCEYLEIDKEILQDKDLMEVFKVDKLISNEKDKLKKKNKTVILFLSITICLIIILLIAIFNHNSFAVYNLEINDSDIKISNGIFIDSKIKRYLGLGELSASFIKKENISQIKIYQKRDYGEILIIEKSYSDDFIISESYGYNEYFDNDFIKYLDSTYIDIKYFDESWSTYSYKLDFKLNFKSNSLFYFKSKAIGPKTPNKEENNENLGLTEKFIKSGYKYNKDQESYIKEDNSNFNYSAFTNSLWYVDNTNNITKSVMYYIDDNEIVSDAYNKKEGKYLYNFTYYIDTKTLDCAIGDCKNNINTIDIVINEYNNVNN